MVSKLFYVADFFFFPLAMNGYKFCANKTSLLAEQVCWCQFREDLISQRTTFPRQKNIIFTYY